MAELRVVAPDGIPEVRAGDDLATIVAAAVELADGDVVVVTSKVVSKAEGRVRAADEAGYRAAVDEETVRVVARRGPVRIVRNRLGLVMAAAGVDRSNVRRDHVVLLPQDPDASARALRERLLELTGRNVGVVVTDTAGRAWREGQTDIAIGIAGLAPVEDYAGRVDEHGNTLAVTLPAVADEIAGAAELAQGKLSARPVAVLSGREDLVLPAGEHGPGAVALQRPEAGDLFGYGAREAVVASLAGDPGDRGPFGSPVPLEELAEVVARVVGGDVATRGTGTLVAPAGTGREVLSALCFSHGWVLDALADEGFSRVVAHVSPGSP